MDEECEVDLYFLCNLTLFTLNEKKRGAETVRDGGKRSTVVKQKKKEKKAK